MAPLMKRPRSLLFAVIMISVAAIAATLIYTMGETRRRATESNTRSLQAGRDGALTNAGPSPAVGRLETLRESRPARAHKNPVQALYAARTLSELEIASSMLTGERVLDAKTMEYWADRFCSFGSYDGGPERSFEEVTRSIAAGSDADGILSARWLDRLRATFCEGRVGPPSFDPLFALNLPSEAGLNELARLEAVSGGLDLDNEDIDVLADDPALAQARRGAKDELRTQVLDFMARTDSPAAFIRAAEMLVTLGDDWYPGGTRAKAERQMTPPYWRMVGSEIAFCHLAPSACAAGGMTVISRCMPLNCRAGESLLDYYRRTQSPQSIEIANAYADALLAMRQGRP